MLAENQLAPFVVGVEAYSDLHALLGDHFETSHNVLLHLDKLGELLGEVRPEGPGGVSSQRMS